jgi:hypothetical protein
MRSKIRAFLKNGAPKTFVGFYTGARNAPREEKFFAQAARPGIFLKKATAF